MFIRYENYLEVKKINEQYGNNIILHVGCLSKQKNHPYLIEIAKKLKNENIGFKIEFVVVMDMRKIRYLI